MSKICIIIINNPADYNPAIRKNVASIIERHGLGVFFDSICDEPLLTCFSNHCSIEIADTPSNNNCEMFLLPDSCYFNGKNNSYSFKNRMKILQEIIEFLYDSKFKLDLFLGDSGTDYDEFKTIKSLPHQLAEILCNNYYDNELCVTNDLHVIIRENM